jgi:uncharacterized protein YbjT (DUF2867 family)
MQTDNANTQQMQPTLVLGANGKTGRRVAQRLRARRASRCAQGRAPATRSGGDRRAGSRPRSAALHHIARHI